MSNGSSSSRLPFTIASFIAGAVFGLALGAFMAYVVLPPNLVLRDAPPSFLRADLTGAKVEYRDLYVARVAQRHAIGVQGGLPDPAFTEAQESLGIASGDASPADALVMVNSALQAATQENLRDGANPDAGRFTLTDENNIKGLADRLTQIQGQPVATPAAVEQAQRNAILFGLLGLLVLGAILVLLLSLLNTFLGSRGTITRTSSTTTNINTTPPAPASDGALATKVQPASALELDDDLLIDEHVPRPTEPGIAMPTAAMAAGAATMQARAASPVAGEALISQFPTAFSHGDDTYDEGFQINSTSGDLIGECGASIVDRYGMDKPSKVTALAIWVFDKNDFHSTKSILMTPFAFRDPLILEKLKKQGDPVQAGLSLFEVLTSTLRVEVEVRNLVMQKIGDDPDGYFEHVDLQFRVFKRPL